MAKSNSRLSAAPAKSWAQSLKNVADAGREALEGIYALTARSFLERVENFEDSRAERKIARQARNRVS